MIAKQTTAKASSFSNMISYVLRENGLKHPEEKAQIIFQNALVDYDAQTAADYGWINRAFPDNDLDAFVENLAKRIDSFDLKIIKKIKATMNERVIIPKNEHIMETQIAFFESLTEPEARTRIKKLLDQGLQTYGDVELNLVKYL